VTYEEAKDVALTFNGAEGRVLIGGTYIHNSSSYLADISQIQMQKSANGGMLRFEIE
jgi:hypothetical protein